MKMTVSILVFLLSAPAMFAAEKIGLAKGLKHWAFQPVKRPEVPGGAKHPVDAFLAVRLKEANLKPNGPVDARSLIRRVSIVLTGLPFLTGGTML